jgi:tetratricopeptide (TPR) repeat protein
MDPFEQAKIHFNNGVAAALEADKRCDSRETTEFLERAIEHYDLAISLAPDQAVFWSAKGQALRITHQTLDAADHIERAIELDPNSWLYLYQLCLCYFDYPMVEQGKAVFEEAVALAGDRRKLELELATELQTTCARFLFYASEIAQMGHPTKAHEILLQALDLIQHAQHLDTKNPCFEPTRQAITNEIDRISYQ